MNTLELLVKNKRLPVLFIGSGIPKRYLYKFPSWLELLKESFYEVNKDPFYFASHINKLNDSDLSDFEKYKKLGTIIEKDYNDAFFRRDVKIKGLKSTSWVKRGISPYRMFLRNRFLKMKLINSEILNDELHEFSKLKNKISAVITTNYDTFIEDFILGDDYTVFARQHEMFSDQSYNIAELYKIHGTINDVETIVISEKDYDQFEENKKLFIAKLLMLFTESPIIFLGYSFTDENIQNIVSDFMTCLTKEQLENINQNFIFITYKKGENELIELKRTIMTKKGTPIPITEIETDNFLEIYKTLNQFVPGTTPKNIRNTKRLIKSIIAKATQSDDSNVIMGIENIPDNFENENIIVAFGEKKVMLEKYGYGLTPFVDIVEDILYDNHKFSANDMCKIRFKSISTQLIPVHKYVKHCTLSIDEIPNNLKSYIEQRNTIEKIVPQNVSKRFKNLPTITTYDGILEYYEESKKVDKTFSVLLKNIEYFDNDTIKNICKYFFEHNKEDLNNSPSFKRAIMIIDLNENL